MIFKTKSLEYTNTDVSNWQNLSGIIGLIVGLRADCPVSRISLKRKSWHAFLSIENLNNYQKKIYEE